MDTWNIQTIEALTEDEAKALAMETMTIKEHAIYFIDFGESFGYSVCAFMDGHHVYHANDYALHHRGEDRAALHAMYIDRMNSRLFTEDELAAPIETPGEYERKDHFLRNYYPQRRDYLSIFFYGSDEEAEERNARAKNMYFDKHCFAFFDDKDFVAHHDSLCRKLEERRAEKANDHEYWMKAFLAQMYNVEYGINWQADYDCLSHFGNIEYTEDDNEIEMYMNQLKFTSAQRSAYRDARREYFRREAAG